MGLTPGQVWYFEINHMDKEAGLLTGRMPFQLTN